MRFSLLSATILCGWLIVGLGCLGVLPHSETIATAQPPTLFDEFRAGPLKDVEQILFAVRKPGEDEHWYANFGYYAASDELYPFPLGTGGALCLLDLNTKEVKTIFKDTTGSVRDPQLHYDGKKILFSYLPGGKKHFNLYEINLDGTGLRQLTTGDWDDFEPAYLPCGDIVFCSSRAKRWVQCWLTQVATIYRCGPNGEQIRELSSNIEQDNTPWVLPNGQVLYMRWEYVDRSQVHYHHLWTMNPDGTRQMVYYGNLTPGVAMLGAKPIVGSDKIVSTFSPGHGRREHYGDITLVDPKAGPDSSTSTVRLTTGSKYADPWGFSETAFMAARMASLDIFNAKGKFQEIFTLPDDLKTQGYWIHEPRPVLPRVRESVIADTTDDTATTGNLALFDVYEGRQMQEVPRGSVKELLIMETLPEPIHYSGGMDQISSGGTFTLERVYGTVPVQENGSAFFELPAQRTFFFIAVDHEGKSVKRMHSFTSVMPGETTTCIGCHEHRTMAPTIAADDQLMKVMNRYPVKPTPIAGIPDVFDFPRDIQPILDRHCVSCHNDVRTDGKVDLSGDWAPLFTRSYLTLTQHNSFGDNRNRAESNFPPYTIGSHVSKLMQWVDTKHQGAEVSPEERKILHYWLEAGANFAGTYAANGTGLIGWSYRNKSVRNDMVWPETHAMAAVISQRCEGCHSLAHTMSDGGGRYSRQYIYNLSEPSRSRVLKAPLSKEAGGSQRCSEIVFANTDDPEYQTILRGIERGRNYILHESNRFSMKPFVADPTYIREMKRYGVLAADFDPKTPIDPYETDRRYWESLWYHPQR